MNCYKQIDEEIAKRLNIIGTRLYALKYALNRSLSLSMTYDKI